MRFTAAEGGQVYNGCERASEQANHLLAPTHRHPILYSNLQLAHCLPHQQLYRFGHLEKRVVELMGHAGKSKTKGPARPVTTNTARASALASPSDIDDVELPDLSAPITAGLGSISLESSFTSYVENDHWSAILDGIAELKEYFDENKVPAAPRATTTDVHKDASVIFAG